MNKAEQAQDGLHAGHTPAAQLAEVGQEGRLPMSPLGIGSRVPAVSDYAVNLPDRDDAIHCANEAEVRQTLEEYRARNPGTLWSGVMIHEMRSTSTVGTERSVFDFLED